MEKRALWARFLPESELEPCSPGCARLRMRHFGVIARARLVGYLILMRPRLAIDPPWADCSTCLRRPDFIVGVREVVPSVSPHNLSSALFAYTKVTSYCLGHRWPTPGLRTRYAWDGNVESHSGEDPFIEWCMPRIFSLNNHRFVRSSP